LFFEYKKREAVGAFTNEDFLFLSWHAKML
jgi:hypothetical protein